MRCYTFPKRKRLSSKKDIDRVFNKGFFLSAGLIRVKYVSSAVRHNRFLISVSRKAGHSPQRNRIKRLIREAVRLHNSKLKSNYDVCLFVTKAPRIALTFSYVEDKIVQIFTELNQQSERALDSCSKV